MAHMARRRHPQGIAAHCGIGLRAPHMKVVLAGRPGIAWCEVHPENYMGDPAAPLALERIRRDTPVSLHGVALSLGSAEGVDADHLARLAVLVARLEPCLVSEHLAWSAHDGRWLNDLLPLPYTEEALGLVVRNVERVQTALRRSILIENPSSYLSYTHSTMEESTFIAEVVRRTGCGVLCDVNNIHVSAHNVGLDPLAYLRALPADAIGEIHLAGHAENIASGRSILIDDHGSTVRDSVWELYRHALERFGRVPTMIEWDSALPAIDVLLAEAEAADTIAARLQPEGFDVLAA